MCENGCMVVFIQHSDVNCACSTAGRCTSILYNHNKLIARLLLSVQGEAGADLT